MNIVCIAGNITQKPELRTTQSDKKVTAFDLAINEGKNKTEFVKCVAWEKTAELITQYCNKGDRLSCSGRLQTRKYTDSNGIDKWITEVVVNQFDFPPKKEQRRMTPEEADDMMHAHAHETSLLAKQQRNELEDEIPF